MKTISINAEEVSAGMENEAAVGLKRKPGRPRGSAKPSSAKRTLVVSMDAELAEKMHAVCAEKDSTVSRELRRLVREFVMS